MGRKILVIDGDSMLHISYNGAKKTPSYTEDGMPNYLIRQFIYRYSKIIKDFDIDDTVFVFDSKEKTFRHDIFPDYKKGRSEKELDFVVQEAVIYSIIEKSGFKSFIVDGYEGDDAVASVAREAERNGYEEIIIATGDKDIYQLITDKIKVFNLNKKLIVDKINILEHFDVTVDKVVSYLCLLGDKADNVSGVEGVGRVTAIDLLKYYDNFVSIFDNIDEVCHKDIGIGKKAWSNLVNIKIGDDPIIDLNMKLITIVDDIDVGNEFKTDENEVEFINVVEILKEMELEVPMNFKRFYGRH